MSHLPGVVNHDSRSSRIDQVTDILRVWITIDNSLVIFSKYVAPLRDPSTARISTAPEWRHVGIEFQPEPYLVSLIKGYLK